MPCCPVCSSDKVYSLLNTWHCKRCKSIWKEGEEDSGRSTAPGPAGTSRSARKKTEPLEIRLARRLAVCLERSDGKFCIATMPWQAGDISRELFMRYLKRCVKDRTLAETKDRYGRIWYSR